MAMTRRRPPRVAQNLPAKKLGLVPGCGAQPCPSSFVPPGRQDLLHFPSTPVIGVTLARGRRVHATSARSGRADGDTRGWWHWMEGRWMMCRTRDGTCTINHLYAQERNGAYPVWLRLTASGCPASAAIRGSEPGYGDGVSPNGDSWSQRNSYEACIRVGAVLQYVPTWDWIVGNSFYQEILRNRAARRALMLVLGRISALAHLGRLLWVGYLPALGVATRCLEFLR